MCTDRSTAGSPAYYTVREAAWMLGVTPSTVSAAIRLGTLRAARRRSQLMVPASALTRLLAAFRGGARSGHRLARHSQDVTRMGGNLLRALGTAGVIVAVQWAVVFFTSDARAWVVALGVPALFAGAAIARMFSATDIIHPPTHQRDHP